MPWCPQCFCEYRDGFQSCADCGAALVDYKPEPLDWASLKPQFLMTVPDLSQSGAIRSLLEPHIPVLIKQPDRDAFPDVDLYVPASSTAEALAVLAEKGICPLAEEAPFDLPSPRGFYNLQWARVKTFVWTILGRDPS